MCAFISLKKAQKINHLGKSKAAVNILNPYFLVTWFLLILDPIIAYTLTLIPLKYYSILIGFIFLIYFWLRWVFITAHGLSLVVASGSYSSLRCTGFSLWWLLLLQSMGSRHTGFSNCGSRALEHRLSSCGARAQLLHGMWDLPGPGLQPVSPALAGGFLTTAPPGKSQL